MPDILHSKLVTVLINDTIMHETRINLAVSKPEPPLPFEVLVRRGYVSFIEADARATAVGIVND
jgi:hypothetical protein